MRTTRPKSQTHSSGNGMYVYLAGAIEYAPDQGSRWREDMTRFLVNELGHRVFNPCIEENHILTPDEFRHFRKWKQTDLRKFRHVVRKLIHTDLTTLINDIDYVVCLWDEHVLKGAGTQGELTFCFYYNIPVYMVSTFPIPAMSSWIIGCTTEIFPHFEALKEFLREKYGRGGISTSDQTSPSP